MRGFLHYDTTHGTILGFKTTSWERIISSFSAKKALHKNFCVPLSYIYISPISHEDYTQEWSKSYKLFFFPKQPTTVTPPLPTFFLKSGPLQGFPGGSVVKSPPEMQETQEMRLQSLSQEGGGNDNPLQHSCLKNSINRRDWTATVHGITKWGIQLIMYAWKQRVEASLIIYHHHDFYHSVIWGIPKSHQSSLVPNMLTGRSVWH